MTSEIGYVVFFIIGAVIASVITWIVAKNSFGNTITSLKNTVLHLENQINDQKGVQLQRDQLLLEREQLATQLSSKNENLIDVEKRLEKRDQDLHELRIEKDHLSILLAEKRTAFAKAEEKHKEAQGEIEKLNEKFTKEFENLANRILEEKSSKFTDQNKINIEQILSPLQEKILLFEKRVEDTHKDTIVSQSALRQQIIGLKELNEQMSKETSNLTKALKGDSKMRGNWGELVLERVLEKSGLSKDSEYSVQQSFKNDDGKTFFPDVVIHLPGDKKMIIDSKVSLNAYERYVNEDDEELQQRHLRDHVTSLKKHVNDLSAKNYHDLYGTESPDFVLLFVPIEPAFAMALNYDGGLYSEAFDKNIVIVTPTTLLATLRTIDSMWKTEKQQRNALDIANAAGALYDKFVGLSEDLIKLGSQLDTVKKSYSSSMNKLTEGSGNLIGRVERLKHLGAKANKSLNEKLVQRAVENDTDGIELDLENKDD
jgi:DNA recombination protein RmuC